MCRNLGMMGPGINQTDLSIIRDLGIISEMGGVDGAGIYQVKSHKYSPHSLDHELMYKSWSTWSQVVTNEIDRKEYRDLLNNTFVDVVIGHVRASTKGGISDSNAHPFVFPGLVGVHNGTLKDSKYIHDKEKTDSELMFKDISERGVETVLTELDRDSAFAIVMYNKIDKKVYFARNELRPLSFAFIEDRAVMYWASEPSMLRFVLDRYGQTYKIFNLKVNTVVKVYADNISTFKIKDDPLKIFEVHCKLERPLPTHIQKMKDEMERKKKEEEEKAAKEAAKSTITCVETTGSTTEGSGAENFPPETQPTLFDIKSRLPKCSCSNYTLTLVQKSMAERGKPGRFTYNHTAGTYHCEKCRSLNVIVSKPQEQEGARVG